MWYIHRALQTLAQRPSRTPLRPICRSLPRWARGCGGPTGGLRVPAVGSPFGPGPLPAQVRVPSEHTEFRPHRPLACSKRARSWPSGFFSFSPLLVPVVCRSAPQSIRSILRSVRESQRVLVSLGSTFLSEDEVLPLVFACRSPRPKHRRFHD